MENLVELGFQARSSFKKTGVIIMENLELEYFRKWCTQNKLNINNSLKAEILWEINLSKLKCCESGVKQLSS